MSEQLKISWRKWRLGFALAVGSGMLSALAVAAFDANWKACVAAFAVSVSTSVKNYLTQFPVENIADTVIIQNPNPPPQTPVK